jgi:hypothetical protein
MLIFNSSQFVIDYPQFSGYTANQLNNYYNNYALIIGAKVLSLFDNVLPATTWDASTNTPTLANGTEGDYPSYLCNVGGTVDFGGGDMVFVAYNLVKYDTYTATWNNVGYPAQYNWSCVVLAHILQLVTNGQVGRVDSATEGSVTGSFSFGDTTSSTWWNQTTFGAMCWQQIKQRGGMTYVSQSTYNGYIL